MRPHRSKGVIVASCLALLVTGRTAAPVFGATYAASGGMWMVAGLERGTNHGQK